MDILLSIIIPVYNLEKYISKSLDNLIAEIKDDVEIVVVNDGSNDNSEQVILDYIDQHPEHCIRLFSKDNGGVSSARNLGILKAKGEYILLLDGDDYLSKGSLNEINRSLSVQKPDIIFWTYCTVSENGDIINRNQFKISENYSENGYAALYHILNDRSFYIVIGNAAYKRDNIIHKGLKFTEDCIAGEDMEFTWKNLASSDKIKFLNSANLNYVQREGSTIHKYNIRRFDSIAAINRAHDYIVDLEECVSVKDDSIIWDKELLVNYAGTYRMILQQKADEESISLKRASVIINNDIDNYYPDLRTQIYLLYKKNRHKLKSNKVAIFFSSPILYVRLFAFKEIVKNFFSGLNIFRATM